MSPITPRPRWLDLIYDEQRILPNKFTIALGEQIRKAREEAKISQAELAEMAYLKQSSISKIESGLRSVSAEDLIYLCYALDKPISYFYASEFKQPIGPNDFLELEEELLIQARRLSKRDLQQLIAQARAIAEFKPPKDREATPEQQQQIIDLLGLQTAKKDTQPAKKKSPPAKKRRKGVGRK